MDEYYNFPNCTGKFSKLNYAILYYFMLLYTECNCNMEGSLKNTCESVSGQCSCKLHVIGGKCTQCEEEYFGFPDCSGKIKSYA